MCGINGIFTKSSSIDLEVEIQSMNKAIAHRGPDSNGYLTDIGLALGHTRLSILDLSESGNQPMASDFDTHIVFNGEVYNYIEIREELRQLGYSFKTGTDTEVILAAYDAWQEECVQRFNGMWAFILLDRKGKRYSVLGTDLVSSPFITRCRIKYSALVLKLNPYSLIYTLQRQTARHF